MIANSHPFDGFCFVVSALSLAPIVLVAVYRRGKLMVTKLKRIWNDHDLSRTTLFLTSITFLLAVAWLILEITGCKWGWMEPLTTLFGLTAGFWALVIDPHTEKENERKRIISAVEDESQTNATTLLEISKHEPNVTAGGIAYARLFTFAIERKSSKWRILSESFCHE